MASKVDPLDIIMMRNATAREIAKRLGVSVKTVERERAKLFNAGEIERKAPRTSRPSEETLAKAKQMLEDRSGYSQVQQTLGVDIKTLVRHFPGYALTPKERADRMVMGRKFNQLSTQL